jgi:sulfoxide reductase heme-binding subunit YedZ
MTFSPRATLNHWIHGIRIYIALAIALLSLEIWWWAASTYGGSSLFAIRLEETYAWFSVGFLCTALAIGPVCGIFKRIPGRNMLYDARRLFGIGAAWFASLHIFIAYEAVFQFANPLHIPGQYRQSIVVGSVAWLILLAMAFTSFNAAMKRMGKWWFRLHRFVYVAIALSLLHAFIVGAQATSPAVLITLAVIVTTLLGLHSYAIIRQGRRVSYLQLLSIGAMTAALMIIFSYGYHQRDQYQGQTSASAGRGGNNVQRY